MVKHFTFHRQEINSIKLHSYLDLVLIFLKQFGFQRLLLDLVCFHCNCHAVKKCSI